MAPNSPTLVAGGEVSKRPHAAGIDLGRSKAPAAGIDLGRTAKAQARETSLQGARPPWTLPLTCEVALGGLPTHSLGFLQQGTVQVVRGGILCCTETYIFSAHAKTMVSTLFPHFLPFC